MRHPTLNWVRYLEKVLWYPLPYIGELHHRSHQPPTIRSVMMLYNLQLVLATVPTCEYSSGLGLEPEPNSCNRSYPTKTRTVAIGPPKTRHFKLTTLALNKYLSTDGIVTRSIRRLCRIICSFTFRVQICNPPNIHLVAINNLPISPKIGRFFRATLRLLFGSPI